MRHVLAAVPACLFVMALLGPGWVQAQEVEIKAPSPPTRPQEPLVIPPGDHGQATRPSDADHYPSAPKVRHEPAFIGPLSSKRADGSGRQGVAGWTSPGTPLNAGSQITRESSGWFAFGFAFEWGGPVVENGPRP
jgi:hypothetical protein